MKKKLTTLLALALFSTGATALTGQAVADDTITLIVSGQGLDGTPAYRLHVGNRSISGRVTQASPGQLDFPVRSANRRIVQMDVEDLNDIESFDVSFTNDTEEGARALVLLGAAINAQRIPVSSFQTTRGAPPTMRRGAMVMVDEATVTLNRTDFGWPGTDEYTAAFNAARVSCIAMPGACPDALTVSFDNAGALTDGVDAGELAAFVSAASASNCVVRATGYASTSGREEFNIALSGDRADALATLLEDAGMADVITRAGGETNRFGANSSDNRVAVATPTRCIPSM
jgi:hypothetical protein